MNGLFDIQLFPSRTAHLSTIRTILDKLFKPSKVIYLMFLPGECARLRVTTNRIFIHATRVASIGFQNLRLSVFQSVFSDDISKIDVAKITRIGIEMFHDESWKPIHFGVKRSKVKLTSHKNIAGCWSLHSCECWLLLAYSVI